MSAWHWLLAVWGTGASLVLAVLLGGTVGVLRIVRRAHPVEADSPWAVLLGEFSRKLSVRRPVRLLVSPRITVPLACGLVRHVVLLPAEGSEWPEERSRAVLLHEIAHLHRRDCLTQALAQIACALYWFNPLSWLAVHRMRIERERACDDHVLNAGVKPSRYANHLLEIARSAGGSRRAALAAVAMARPGQLESRLLAVLDPKRSRRALTRFTVGVAVVALACLLLPLAAVKLSEAAAKELETASSGTPGAKVTLLGGATVELLALSYHPSEGRVWWQADGSLTERPHTGLKGPITIPGSRQRLYEIVIRTAGSSDMTVHCPGDSTWSPGEPFRVCVLAFPESQRSASVKLGLANGEWRTLAEAGTDPAETKSGNVAAESGGPREPVGEFSVVFAAAVESAKGLVLTVTHQLAREMDYRIVLIAADGKTHVGGPGSQGAPGFTQSTVHFDGMSLAQVDRFLFQVRPYQWVEFRNVSLEPGRKTKVEVVAQPAGSRPTTPSGPVAAQEPKTASGGARAEGLAQGRGVLDAELERIGQVSHLQLDVAGVDKVLAQLDSFPQSYRSKLAWWKEKVRFERRRLTLHERGGPAPDQLRFFAVLAEMSHADTGDPITQFLLLVDDFWLSWADIRLAEGVKEEEFWAKVRSYAEDIQLQAKAKVPEPFLPQFMDMRLTMTEAGIYYRKLRDAESAIPLWERVYRYDDFGKKGYHFFTEKYPVLLQQHTEMYWAAASFLISERRGDWAYLESMGEPMGGTLNTLLREAKLGLREQVERESPEEEVRNLEYGLSFTNVVTPKIPPDPRRSIDWAKLNLRFKKLSASAGTADPQTKEAVVKALLEQCHAYLEDWPEAPLKLGPSTGLGGWEPRQFPRPTVLEPLCGAFYPYLLVLYGAEPDVALPVTVRMYDRHHAVLEKEYVEEHGAKPPSELMDSCGGSFAYACALLLDEYRQADRLAGLTEGQRGVLAELEKVEATWGQTGNHAGKDQAKVMELARRFLNAAARLPELQPKERSGPVAPLDSGAKERQAGAGRASRGVPVGLA